MNRRVVITGMGVATPLGMELEPYWQNLLEGKSGIVEISRFDTTRLRLHDCGRSPRLRSEDGFQ